MSRNEAVMIPVSDASFSLIGSEFLDNLGAKRQNKILKRFFANHNCKILDGGKVTFGDHVFIAPNCLFTTAEHALDAGQCNAGLEVELPIKK